MTERVQADWPAPPVVRAFTTTREGGISEGGYASMNLGAAGNDDPAHVAVNRQRFEAWLPSQPGWLKQVHGARVIRREVWSEGDNEADASWCATPGLACTVLTADCLPVLFCDREAQVVAAAHAGWRGLLAGVLENTIAAMPVEPGTLMAWIGPCIGVGAYEVGDEFKAQFLRQLPWLKTGFAKINGETHADLAAIARALMERAGVKSVHGGELCTYTESQRFYSHRRNPNGGRMASTIWLQGKAAS